MKLFNHIIIIKKCLLAALLVSCSKGEVKSQSARKSLDVLSYVNTFLGVDGDGNDFPGAITFLF